ncbi:Group II intron, maturase-specific domain [Pelotomaculum sp. FP]|nr:Group II intron, maturase-specific domain [Pelotomaculum sp. FP]
MYESREYHNCVFVGRDAAGTPRFASVRGTYGNFKQDIESSDKRYNFVLPSCPPSSRFVAVCEKTLEDLSNMFNPVIRGWVNYYGRFYKSEMYSVLRHMNRALVRWARRKYKRLAIHQRRANYWLGRIARQEPKLFVQWKMGILPGAG